MNKKITRLLKLVINWCKYLFWLFLFLMVVDVYVFHQMLGFGYPRHFQQENIQRYPAPYVMFTGKPGAADHNEMGFRGRSIVTAPSDAFVVAFFGGSTGYLGDPPIPDMLEKDLEQALGRKVFVANFSVVSSNHRQHLHAMLEYLPLREPDMVIFYGGYNETAQPMTYDPRPGYPYNYFYREETPYFNKWLMENSALFGEFDKATGRLSGLKELQKQYQPGSDNWFKQIGDKYFQTMRQAKSLATTMHSNYCGHTEFLGFYQPYRASGRMEDLHKYMQAKIATEKWDYLQDVSHAYDALGDGIYVDVVHVTQNANEVMAKTMTNKILEQLNSGTLVHCSAVKKPSQD